MLISNVPFEKKSKKTKWKNDFFKLNLRYDQIASKRMKSDNNEKYVKATKNSMEKSLTNKKTCTNRTRSTYPNMTKRSVRWKLGRKIHGRIRENTKILQNNLELSVFQLNWRQARLVSNSRQVSSLIKTGFCGIRGKNEWVESRSLPAH